jgi:hypothetical protein
MAKAQTQTGKRAIRAKFTDALRALDDENPPDYCDPNQPRDGIKPGAWPGAPFANLPPACPVSVVGFDVDQKLWLKNARGYLMTIERFDANTLTSAFSPQTDYLLWAWPAFGAKKITNSDGGTEEINFVKRLEVQQAAMCCRPRPGASGCSTRTRCTAAVAAGRQAGRVHLAFGRLALALRARQADLCAAG